MASCAIRYRLDRPGPAAFLVDCDGHLRLYTRGVLGGVMAASRLLSLLAERGCRWVPAHGTVEVALDSEVPKAREERLPPPPHVWQAAGEGDATIG